MSSSRDFSHGHKFGRAPEKSNFAQTCNLLSQYLKERGNITDISLEIAGKLETKGNVLGKAEMSDLTTRRMNFLINVEKSVETSTQNGKSSMDLLPQYVEIGSSIALDDALYKATSSKPAAMEPETAQMTILYSGQVFVFDNFPAKKAREMMLLASKGSSPNSTDFAPTSFVASASTTLPNSGSNPAQERLQSQTQATNSDMPLARRASLHRFFEKRKDRVTARAPYQLHSPSPAYPKLEEQLELRL